MYTESGSRNQNEGAKGSGAEGISVRHARTGICIQDGLYIRAVTEYAMYIVEPEVLMHYKGALQYAKTPMAVSQQRCWCA